MLIQPQPSGFINHEYAFDIKVNKTESEVWKWLNDPETFTKTQYWPYRVEFYSPDPENIPNGFHEGVLTNHHGPLVNFAGVLTKIKPNYRDLQYYYGSYALSFRWIRPFRLEFSTSVDGPDTIISCKISCYVKPWIALFWDKAQTLFWKSFKRWARKHI